VFVVKPCKIAEHAAAKVSLRLGLMFQVDQKERILSAKSGANDQIRFMRCSRSDVGKNLLVQENQRSFVQVTRQFGQKKVHEITEEFGQQFLEKPVMVNHARIVQAARPIMSSPHDLDQLAKKGPVGICLQI
jgi:hypothetical protein